MKVKYLVVVLGLITLSGCASELDEARVAYACKNKGGVFNTDYPFQRAEVTCNNGEKVKVKSIIQDPAYWNKPKP